MRVRVGVASWALPPAQHPHFPAEGSHLERYAAVFPAVEINSSFHRPHRPATYARWAASVPPDFRFAVKVPRDITHQRKLRDVVEPLARFVDEASHLGDRLGPLLVQLPPSHALDVDVAHAFFTGLRTRFAGEVCCEPRHASWFTPEGEALLAEHRVARVAADPALAPSAALPGGWDGFAYYRLHGSPYVYYSSYAETDLRTLAGGLLEARRRAVPVWCIFDNTAGGAAVGDARRLLELLDTGPAPG